MLTKQELGRQLLHILIGIATIALIYFQILSPLAIFLLIIIGMILSLISKRTKLPFFSFFLNHFERKENLTNFPGKGMIFFFVGVLLSLKLFELDIALAAIAILTLGDSISHIIGERFGQLTNIFNGKSKKLFEGTIAGAFAGTIGAIFFVSLPEAIIASFAAMAVEVVQIDLNQSTIDDNIIVPLVAGTVIFLMRIYL